jgi:hypothetical protein
LWVFGNHTGVKLMTTTGCLPSAWLDEHSNPRAREGP